MWLIILLINQAVKGQTRSQSSCCSRRNNNFLCLFCSTELQHFEKVTSGFVYSVKVTIFINVKGLIKIVLSAIGKLTKHHNLSVASDCMFHLNGCYTETKGIDWHVKIIFSSVAICVRFCIFS